MNIIYTLYKVTDYMLKASLRSLNAEIIFLGNLLECIYAL